MYVSSAKLIILIHEEGREKIWVMQKKLNNFIKSQDTCSTPLPTALNLDPFNKMSP